MEKVILRKITLEDTPNIIKWRNNPSVQKNFCIQEPLTEEMHYNWFHNKIETGEVAQFIIVDAETNLPVGSTYLRDIDFKNRKAEFGIFIGEDSARGKGLGAESTKLMIEYGFHTLQLHRIFLRVFSNNLGAIKAYEKAGFIYEGTAKQDIILQDGTYQDIVFMAILKKE